MSAPHIWSEDLQQQTRDAIENMEINPISHGLHMKSTRGEYGTINVADLLSDKLDIAVIGGQTVHFGSLDELLAAGWAID
jgi:hypothetical protein